MIETERLILRHLEPRDRDALVAMLTNQELMADLKPFMTEELADATIAKHRGLYEEGLGLGFLIVERREDGAVAGFCGLKRGEPNSSIGGETEAGWIIDLPWWRQGYAREAMEAILAWAWENVETDGIYAITSAANLKSQGLMTRLGMHPLPERAYESPNFPEGHRLRPMVAFMINRP